MLFCGGGYLRILKIGDLGMETPTSIFLLTISSLLIFSVLNALPEDGAGDKELWNLRQHQVNSMGDVIGRWNPFGTGESLILGLSSLEEDTAFVRDGEDISVMVGESPELLYLIEEFLSSSPDGLPCILFVDLIDQNDITIEGSFVTWSHVILARMVIRLFLPLERGSFSIEGRVLG
jgi:hypothetical protein